MSERERLVAVVEQALRERCVYVVIGGCGCCESPWMTVHDADGNEVGEVGNVRINSCPPTANTKPEDET